MRALSCFLTVLLALNAIAEEKTEDGAQQSCIGIGIDLGTTFSVASILQYDNIEVISNAHGNQITPSVVYYSDKNEPALVGEQAESHQQKEPKRVLTGVKRLIGRPYDDPVVKKESSSVMYDIAKLDGMAAVSVDKKVISIASVSSEILRSIKRNVQKYLDTTDLDKSLPVKTVVTVPAYFNDNQRKETMTAASLAGLDLIQILSEPVAAAISSKQLNDAEGNLLVVDIGGGTFDISILEVDSGIYTSKATTGDLTLGGIDFTNAIVDIVEEQAKSKGKEIKDKVNLFKTAEGIKIRLSREKTAEYDIEDMSGVVTRTQFNKKVAAYSTRMLKLADDALQIAGMKASDLKYVLLTGGSARNLFIQEAFKKKFNVEPLISETPDTAIAEGAAIVSALHCGHSDAEAVLISHTQFAYGVNTKRGDSDYAAHI